MEIPISTWALLVTTSSRFYASTTSSRALLIIAFTDKSTDTHFGLETLAIKAVIQHSKALFVDIKAVKYTVSLAVRNAAASNTKTMSYSEVSSS